MDLSYLSSSAGIVAATMVIVEVIKRFLGNRAVFRSAPTWTVACAVSGALTGVGLWTGLLQEPGPWYGVLLKILGLAATASGFWTWLRAPNDQLQDSERATRARAYGTTSTLLVVLAAGALATGCGAASSPTLTPTEAQQARLRDLARVATVSQRVGTLVESLQTAEIAFHQAGRVTREDHRVIQLSLKITADTVVHALEQLKDFTQPEVNRRQWVSAAIGAVQRLISDGLRPILDDGARMELQLIASSITAILISLELTVSAAPAPPAIVAPPPAPPPAAAARLAMVVTGRGGRLCLA